MWFNSSLGSSILSNPSVGTDFWRVCAIIKDKKSMVAKDTTTNKLGLYYLPYYQWFSTQFKKKKKKKQMMHEQDI